MKRISAALLALVLCLASVSCLAGDVTKVKVGVVGENNEQWEQVIALQPSDLDELRSRAARDDTAMRLASYTLSDRLEILKIFFSAHDLLWAALALISAYQLAARSGRNDEF